MRPLLGRRPGRHLRGFAMKNLLATLLFVFVSAPFLSATTRYVGCTNHGTGAGTSAANRMAWTTATALHVAGDDYIWDEQATAESPAVLNATGCNVDTTGLNGVNAGNLTTITANPEGSVVIYGAGARAPVKFNNNSYVQVVGFNLNNIKNGPAGCSNGGGICGVATFTGTANHNTISRSTMCNAATNWNVHVVLFSGTTHDNLIEDSFICGSGRKSVEQHGPPNNTLTTANRIRRTFIYSGGSENAGPSPRVSMTYSSRGFILDNVFITADRRPDIDIGTDPVNDGAVQDGSYRQKNNGVTTATQMNNWDIESGSDANYGLIGNDQITSGLKDGRLLITGCLVFLPSGADWHQPGAMFSMDQLIDVQVNQTILVNKSTNVKSTMVGFRLPNCTAANCTPYILQSITNSTFINSSGTGTTDNTIGTNWTSTNVKTGSSIGAVYTGGGTPYVPLANQGGGLCKQSIDGVIGTDNLFPLVMESRVALEMARLGKGSYSMTAAIEDALGSSVPAACGGTGATPTPTNTATNTATATRTFTPTKTFTPSNTATSTPTLTPSNTPTPVPTWTPPAPTFTQTFTPSATLTPSQTRTPTVTPTPNLTPGSPILINSHQDIFVDQNGRELFRAWVTHPYNVFNPPPHRVMLGPTPTPTP